MHIQLRSLRRRRGTTAVDLQRLKKQLTDFSEPESPINPDSSVILQTKIELEKLYKKFLLELSKSHDGDESLYILKSPDFCAVEHGLNAVIMRLQDHIEHKRADRKSLGSPRTPLCRKLTPNKF